MVLRRRPPRKLGKHGGPKAPQCRLFGARFAGHLTHKKATEDTAVRCKTAVEIRYSDVQTSEMETANRKPRGTDACRAFRKDGSIKCDDVLALHQSL